MIRTALSLVALGSFVVVGTGCSGIRVVKKTPDGGIVALQGSEGGAREKADQYMRSQCAEGYDIVEEGEAVVGSDTTVRQQKTFLGPTATAQSTDRHEWRITFKCKGAKAAKTQTFVVQL